MEKLSNYIIPYRTRYDRDDNLLYEFKFKPITGNQKDYTTEIKVDEFGDNVLVDTYCDCADAMYRENKFCKHVNQAIEILKEYGIKIIIKKD